MLSSPSNTLPPVPSSASFDGWIIQGIVYISSTNVVKDVYTKIQYIQDAVGKLHTEDLLLNLTNSSYCLLKAWKMIYELFSVLQALPNALIAADGVKKKNLTSL